MVCGFGIIYGGLLSWGFGIIYRKAQKKREAFCLSFSVKTIAQRLFQASNINPVKLILGVFSAIAFSFCDSAVFGSAKNSFSFAVGGVDGVNGGDGHFFSPMVRFMWVIRSLNSGIIVP